MEILAKKVKEKGLFERDYIFIKGALYLGRGWNLRHKFDGKKPRIVDIYKAPDMRSTHLVTLGRSRWGKTRLLERVIVDDIESGLSIFHLDPKLDYDGTEAIIDAVDKTERYDDVLLFIPPYPEVSIRINPFAGLLPDAISDIVKAMAPSSKEEFFRELAGEIAKSVSTALYLLGETEINFATLFKYTSVEEINELYKKVQNTKAGGYVQIGDELVEKARLKADALLSLNKLRQKDKAYWSKVNTTIELILSQITTGKVGQVFGRAKGNPFRERLLLGKPVIFSGLIGSLYIGKDPAQKITRMINAMSEKVYGAIYKKFSRLNPPLAEYWDEGSITIYAGAEEKINKVGGAGGYIHIFTQSLADFKMNIGEEQTKVFIDNADVVLMSVKDTETAEYFSRSAGEIDRFKPIWNKEEITAMPTKEPLIPPDQFMRLNKGAFHAFIEGKWYQGYSPLLKGRRRLIIAPLPYEERRIFEHFKRKYNIDDRTATEWIRKYDVVYDYDWILKEGLADGIIDLREFPYYKNYVANYKEDLDKEIAISSGLDIEKLKENADLIRQALNQKQGIFPKAILKDNRLFLDLYLYQKIFGKPAESRETITIEGKNKEYALIVLDSETLSLFKAHV